MQRGRGNKVAKSYKKRYTPLNVNREGYENMPDGRSKSSPFQQSTYRAPQANKVLVAGEKEAHKTTGGTVGAQFLQNMAKDKKEKLDKATDAVIGMVTKSVKPTPQ